MTSSEQTAIPLEAEHMEMVEVQLLLALSGTELPISGLDLSNDARVPVDDAFPALQRLVSSGYVAHERRHYTLTAAGTRLARQLAF